ncbi:MAG: uroporphyrinogen-III synthase [Cereibacter sphaeroides]|uniref:Uroporphyrinogen-III synthase n=1 Tax=Cereibacter sphaeroides TaxID=1063 RepID=A0A2W5TPN3_CERSP|nr:MAG: uroporphyrinogen-III synthase [Cereibacter sphaeroides]
MPAQSHGSALPPFLLTRPAAQNVRFAARLRGRFGEAIRIVQSPLFEPRFLAPEIPDQDFRGVVFTSETGVEAFERLGIPAKGRAWCVGDRTAEAARRLGFDAISAGGSATELAQVLARLNGPLLYPRARHTAVDLGAALKDTETRICETIVYEQFPLPINEEANRLLVTSATLVAPLFSPRSASQFAQSDAVLDRRAQLFAPVMSGAVAKALEPAHPERVVVASRPDVVSMLAAIADLVATPGQP